MPGNRSVLRLAGGLIAALVVVTCVFAYVSPYYNRLIVGASNIVIGLIEHPRRTVLAAEGTRGLVLERLGGRDYLFAGYNTGLQYEVVLFLALLLATPCIRALKKFAFGLVGLLGLVLFHTAAVTVYARGSVMRSYTHSMDESLSAAGAALAVLLWGLLTFRYWLSWPRRAVAVETNHVGRNDPCPCGSGKKYKWCCGRR
jgi:hypothetical protein